MLLVAQGLTPAEAAAVCDVSPEAMRQRLSRARAMLAKRLDNPGAVRAVILKEVLAVSAIHPEDPLFGATRTCPRVEATAEHAERVRGRCRTALQQPQKRLPVAFEPATVGTVCGVRLADRNNRHESRSAVRWPEAFIQDVRFGWRMLRRSPAVSLFAIIAIALGIGINTMVFSLANAVLFKALPVPGADRLVFVGTRTEEGKDRTDGLSWAEFQALKSQVRSIAALSGAASTAADLNDDRGSPKRCTAPRSPRMLSTAMGVKMPAGRTFVESDARPACHGSWCSPNVSGEAATT